EEQTEILNFINVQSNKINDSIELIERQIEKLKEYKTTLINSAVTGKIKVA
ncbi:MAG: restriction endonuclease subunit S, partial [gamma proteobacterium symbiont of Ctena orbiculata]